MQFSFFVVYFNGTMAKVVSSLISSLLHIPMTVVEWFSFDEYFKLEWAAASTNPNELVMVLGLFFHFFSSLRLSFLVYTRQGPI